VVDYGGTLIITGTAHFATNQSFSDLTLSGTLTGSGDVTVNGLMTWTDGNMEGSGKTVLLLLELERGAV